MSAIAGAIWTQNISLAEALLRRSQLARDHLIISHRDGATEILLKDQGIFGMQADEANSEFLQGRIIDNLWRPETREIRSPSPNVSRIWVSYGFPCHGDS